ncbi:hypothetical protein Cylst_0462 [Cylindrospermum stagnale PCC 7417]|uniref:FIST domain-containing protein n=1 Tax=Cylindrospermum stagnale PCC 7417 TaxID=56107 RepID=K9WSP9_9NOST|nr:FIST N-terminal domain-containing protein [Cylindrospermum stagnale]AFZ22806.1 hypothetical protein Cylst_0462 [Cylindrospermum stagnale PCC 7417]
MLKVAVGHSIDPDALAAIDEVIEQCSQSLGGEVPQAGILFTAIDFDHSLILERIQNVFSGMELIGGTTDGEMSSVLNYQQDSVTLMVFCSDQVKIHAGLGRGVSTDPIAATQQAVEDAQRKSKLETKLCLTVPESLTTSGVGILDGLKQALGENTLIIGGTTADQQRMKHTYQFFNGEVLSDSVPILLFAGDLLFSSGMAGGWKTIGKVGVATKVDRNILYEIDGKPALEFYLYYLGAPPSDEYPLAVYEPSGQRYFMRAPNGYDEHTGSIRFFTDIPALVNVQMLEASREELVLASETSFRKALESYPGKEPMAAVLISCAARRHLLGTRTQGEYQTIKAGLAKNLPCCGFYSYGELAPLEPQSETYFHNETFVTLLLGVK